MPRNVRCKRCGDTGHQAKTCQFPPPIYPRPIWFDEWIVEVVNERKNTISSGRADDLYR